MAEEAKKQGSYSMLVGSRIDIRYDPGGFAWNLWKFFPASPPTSEGHPHKISRL